MSRNTSISFLLLSGLGLLSAFIAEKSGRSDLTVFSLGALFFFALHPLFEQIDWASYLPIPLAGYLYTGSGSAFPLFPWTGYALLGGALGSWLASPQAPRRHVSSARLAVACNSTS